MLQIKKYSKLEENKKLMKRIIGTERKGTFGRSI